MTYRDDHDAALARADALQEELDQLKAEREREHAEAAAAAAAPKPAVKPFVPDAPPLPRSAVWSWLPITPSQLGYGLLFLAVIALAAVIGISSDHRKADKRATADARRRADLAADARLELVANVEPCIARAIWDDEENRQTDVANGSATAWATKVVCVEGIETAIAARDLPPGVATELQELATAQHALDALSHGDAAYPAAATRRARALVAVHGKAVPWFRGQLDALVTAYERTHRRDAVWWRAHFQQEMRGALDAALGASHVLDGGPVDMAAASAAARPLAGAAFAELAQAPAESQKVAWGWKPFTREVSAEGGELRASTISLVINNEGSLGDTQRRALVAK